MQTLLLASVTLAGCGAATSPGPSEQRRTTPIDVATRRTDDPDPESSSASPSFSAYDGCVDGRPAPTSGPAPAPRAAPPPPLVLVGTEEGPLREALLAGRPYPAPVVDPETIQVEGVAVRVRDIRDPSLPDFASRNGGIDRGRALRAYEEHWRRIFQERFGLRTFVLYTNDFRAPNVVQGSLPDVDGRPVGVEWHDGEIRFDRENRNQRLAKIREVTGWIPELSEIEGEAIRRVYGRDRFFTSAGDNLPPEATPLRILARVAPSPAGHLLPTGETSVVERPQDLSRGVLPVCNELDAAVASAAMLPLHARTIRRLRPAQFRCAASRRGIECTTSYERLPGRSEEFRLRFDERGVLRSVLSRPSGPGAAWAWPYAPPADCANDDRATAVDAPGVRVADSEEDFRDTHGCSAPSGIDWRRERLALVTIERVESSRYVHLDRARSTGGRIAIDLRSRVVLCQGIPPQIQTRVVRILLPRGDEPVAIGRVEYEPNRCGPVGLRGGGRDLDELLLDSAQLRSHVALLRGESRTESRWSRRPSRWTPLRNPRCSSTPVSSQARSTVQSTLSGHPHVTSTR